MKREKRGRGDKDGRKEAGEGSRGWLGGEEPEDRRKDRRPKSTRKEEGGREKERVETERVAPLQESEWTLPPGMFF